MALAAFDHAPSEIPAVRAGTQSSEPQVCELAFNATRGIDLDVESSTPTCSYYRALLRAISMANTIEQQSWVAGRISAAEHSNSDFELPVDESVIVRSNS